MTEEQIRQNAEAYASKFAPAKKHKTGIPLAINHTAMISFIAGAHSRDEEIKELEKKVSALETVIITARATISTQEAIIKGLRNPWISVKERLPEENKDNEGYSVKVIGLFEGDGKEYISDCFCSIEEGIWFVDIFTSDQPIAWMSIPQIEKGE